MNLQTVYDDSAPLDDKIEALREYVLSLRSWRSEDTKDLQALKKKVDGIWVQNQLQHKAQQMEQVYG